MNNSRMNRDVLLALGVALCFAIQGWAQDETRTNLPPQPPVPAMVGLDRSAAPVPAETNDPDANEDRMFAPPQVSGQTYPVALTSQERSNYLRGGLTFTTAYTDNALGGVSTPVSDISYSVAPNIALDETTTRLHYLLTYAPGFTFYNRLDARNQADHNASIEFEYRLSPHVTFSARDTFQKSSNVFNQPMDNGSNAVGGGAQGPNFSVIAPIADMLSNTGSAGMTYQYARNDMVGASGTFSNLHYPDPSQVPGLFDSSVQGGLAFYSRRVARRQYVGVTYEYQRLMSYPTAGANETQTHAALFFYTVTPIRRLSLSFFGGPQFSDTTQPSPFAPLHSWKPAGGASIGWQGRLNSFAMSYTHIVASGGGLMGAVELDSAAASARQQITRTLSATVSGLYAQNNVIGSPLLGATNGHSISGTASLQQMLGQHLGVQLGYTRIHQTYSDVQVISATPDTNREFISISYQFSKALGR